jgi:hypothetical protein
MGGRGGGGGEGEKGEEGRGTGHIDGGVEGQRDTETDTGFDYVKDYPEYDRSKGYITVIGISYCRTTNVTAHTTRPTRGLGKGREAFVPFPANQENAFGRRTY